jgi:hypothetical protein
MILGGCASRATGSTVDVGKGRTVAAGAAGSRVAVARPAGLWVLLLGAAVAAATGAYAGLHEPAGRPLTTLGFSGVLQMKAWLTTAAAILLLVQLMTALWMWGRLPGAGRAPSWTGLLHRWSGTVAFVLTLPVAFHCIWSLGFNTDSTRVVVHGLAGCLFYGAYAAKMLGLRVRGLPGWGLPVLGGTVLASLVLVWLTSALWFFTRSGIPLT